MVKKKEPNFKKGTYHLINPKKFTGVPPVIYRSSYEYIVMNALDTGKNVLEWKSESDVVPYFSPVDNKHHRYYIDFYVKIMFNGKLYQYLIEIKPQYQYEKPTADRFKTKDSFKRACEDYIVNISKWKYADRYAKERGMLFIVLTEKNLGKLVQLTRG